MVVIGDHLNCGQCAAYLNDPNKKGYEPLCWSRRCPTSEYQYRGVELWVSFVLLLKRSEIAAKTMDIILEAADAKDPETLELLIEFEMVFENLLAERRAQERQKAKK